MPQTAVAVPADCAPDSLFHARLETILRADAMIMDVLHRARAMALPDWLVVSGAVYQTVWNRLGGHPALTGIKDVDLVYCDAGDLSWEAEDRIIRQGAEIFADCPVPAEIRNQARVHLWFEAHFGTPYAPIAGSAEGLTRYASIAHAVGVRLEPDGRLTIEAPFGLADLFERRLRRNRGVADNGGHRAKAERMLRIWPELTVEWD